jgi:hypothetical protein
MFATKPVIYGVFSFDGVNVDGPKDYLVSRGNVRLDAILAGTAEWEDEASVLRQLDADYRLWLAARQP